MEELPDESDCSDQPSTRIISSDQILLGQKEVWIEHGTEMYRLRVTASGKLYLTK